jgi:hypoxanthine phosphoribosyltransferase
MNNTAIHPDISRVLFSAEQIAVKTAELAERINRDYADCKVPLVLVGILKGSFIFLADLARLVRVPHRIEFMAVSSYAGTSSGTVKIVMDLRQDIAGSQVRGETRELLVSLKCVA